MLNTSNLNVKKRLDAYSGRKNQLEKRVRTMNKKRTLEIFIERSEGSLLQKQIKSEQIAEIKILQEIKAAKNISKKDKRRTVSFSHTEDRIRSQKRHATQNIQNSLFDSPINFQVKDFIQQSKRKENILANIFNNNFSKAQKQQTSEQKNEMMQTKKFSARPALQQLQTYLKQEDPLVLERRKRIVQMLILCLMRRCHKKLCEALDAALEAYTFFFNIQRQNYLKTICLKLIGKIYKQILVSQKNKRRNLETKKQARAAIRLARKRHSSIMIKTLASQRVFFTRFAKKYSQSKLLLETDYRKQYDKLRSNYHNFKEQNQIGEQNNKIRTSKNIRQSQKRDNIVLMKINQGLAVALPQPQKVFPSLKGSTQQLNYNLVIHQRDIESASKLFPYEYPLSLEKILSKKEYIFLLSTINGLIFSQTRCYTIFQVFKKMSTYFILLILLLMGLTFAVINFDGVDWMFQSLFLVGFGIVCYGLIQKDTSPVYGGGEGNEKVLLQLQRWNRRYLGENVNFRVTSNWQALIISWPRDENEMTVSDSECDSINESSLEKGSARSDNSLLSDGFDTVKQVQNRIEMRKQPDIKVDLEDQCFNTICQQGENPIKYYQQAQQLGLELNQQQQARLGTRIGQEQNLYLHQYQQQKAIYSDIKQQKKAIQQQRITKPLKPILDIIIDSNDSNTSSQYPHVTKSSKHINNTFRTKKQINGDGNDDDNITGGNLFVFQYFLDDGQSQFQQHSQTTGEEVGDIVQDKTNDDKLLQLHQENTQIKQKKLANDEQNNHAQTSLRFEEIDLDSQQQDRVIQDY